MEHQRNLGASAGSRWKTKEFGADGCSAQVRSEAGAVWFMMNILLSVLELVFERKQKGIAEQQSYY